MSPKLFGLINKEGSARLKEIVSPEKEIFSSVGHHVISYLSFSMSAIFIANIIQSSLNYYGFSWLIDD